ncbi:MAG: hypothetical protein MHM6MM_000348 [Cercozoa sp. M6MM]
MADQRDKSERIRQQQKQATFVLDNEIRQDALNTRLAAFESDDFAERDDVGEDAYVAEDDEQQTASIADTGKRKKPSRETVVLPKLKGFGQLLEEADLQLEAAWRATYLTSDASETRYPARKLCAVCQLSAAHTCLTCGRPLCSLRCRSLHNAGQCLRF